jgi:hypothetical protein
MLKSQNINMKQCKQTLYLSSFTLSNDTFLILPANLQQPTPNQGNKFLIENYYVMFLQKQHFLSTCTSQA